MMASVNCSPATIAQAVGGDSQLDGESHNCRFLTTYTLLTRYILKVDVKIATPVPKKFFFSV